MLLRATSLLSPSELLDTVLGWGGRELGSNLMLLLKVEWIFTSF